MPEYTSTNWRGLEHVIQRDHPDFIVNLAAGPKGMGRLASAARFGDAEGFRFTGENAVWFETPLEERAPRDDEFTGYRESHFWDAPESCYAIDIPDPELIREWIRDEDLDAHESLGAGIESAERRDTVVRELQQDIELNHWRQNKLDANAYPDGMYSEWHPDKDHNDRRDRAHLQDMAGMRKDAYKASWGIALGLTYTKLYEARTSVLGINERRLDAREIVALDIVSSVRDHASNESYCQHCGAVWTAELFLNVEIRGYEDRNSGEAVTRRVCEHCAERWAGTWESYDGETYHGDWTEQALARARDERAERLGGQRRLEGYAPGNGDDADA